MKKQRFVENRSEENENHAESIKIPDEEISKINLANVTKKDNEEEKVTEPQV